MTDFLASAAPLWLAVGILVTAVLIGFSILVVPGPARVPLARRRPQGEAGPTKLESAADATTSSIEKLLRGRGGSASALLDRAGVKQPLKDLIVLVGAAMLAAAAGGLLLGGPLLGIGGVVLVGMLARLWVGLKISRRQNAFARQLDETLQILAGSLRAGYSLPQAVNTVATEGVAPTSEEFSRIVNETRVGRPMVEALEDSAARLGNEDFFWITQAISINREVGGNLAEVLDGVGQTIRERSQLRGQVKSLAAEGKLSAIILVLLPIAIFAMIWTTNRDYVAPLFTNVIGNVMLGVAGMLLIVGILWLRKTVEIKF